MTTAAENERLGVLETKVNSIERDVTEIKSDVKSIIATQQSLAIALAARQAADEQQRKDRSNTGVWVRTVVPWFLMGVGLMLTLINTFDIVASVSK